MGARLGLSRPDISEIPHRHQSTTDSNIHETNPNSRRLSHIHTSSESGPHRSRHTGGHRGISTSSHTANVVPSSAALNSLISELEASELSNQDAQLLRFLCNLRSNSSTSNGSHSNEACSRTRRSHSIMDSGQLTNSIFPIPTSSSSSRTNRTGQISRNRRNQRRNRTTSMTISGEDEDDDDFEIINSLPNDIQTPVQLSAASRQALLSLATHSSVHNRQWPESLLIHDGRDKRCIFCKQIVPHDQYDLHYVMCLTKPQITYNKDKLLVDKGECSICLDDMKIGDEIARLPCLCIYHKNCIDAWFQRKRTCPEHPGD